MREWIKAQLPLLPLNLALIGAHLLSGYRWH